MNEGIVEEAALAWLEAMGCAVVAAPALASGREAAERSDGQLVLSDRLRRALAKLINGALRVPDAERIVERCA